MSVHEPQALRESAYQSASEGRLDDAYGLLQTLFEQEGGLQTCNDLAVVCFRLGRVDEALGYFRQAHRLRAEAGELLFENLMDALEGLRASPLPEVSSQAAVSVAPVEEASAWRARWMGDSASALHADALKLNDAQWASALFDSVAGKPFEGHLLPGFIGEDAQRMFVGSAGVPALQEAQRFMQVLLAQLGAHGLALTDDSVAVDFGCGWGRYTRFMLKYVHPDNLYGLEVNSGMVEHCRKAFGMANFLKVGTMPPCPLRTGMVDLIFGYSVFSHLAPQCATAWIDEFARITKPGALVCMTTQGRSFIEFCREVRESGDRSHPWFISLAKAFADTDRAYDDYDAGQFLHFGEGQYGGTYGESLIPRGYIQRHWGRYFDLVDFIDDRAVLPQALFVLKRNEHAHVA